MNVPFRRGLTALLALACIGAGTADAAMAGTRSSSRTYACGAVKAGGKAVVGTRLIAAQKGSKLVLGAHSYALAQHVACNQAPPPAVTRGVNVRSIVIKWTISAKGVGIDSCGLALPFGGDCSGSSFTKTMEFDDSEANTWHDSMDLPGGFYFDAGRVGNFTSVCSTVVATFKQSVAVPTSTTACVDV